MKHLRTRTATARASTRERCHSPAKGHDETSAYKHYNRRSEHKRKMPQPSKGSRWNTYLQALTTNTGTVQDEKKQQKPTISTEDLANNKITSHHHEEQHEDACPKCHAPLNVMTKMWDPKQRKPENQHILSHHKQRLKARLDWHVDQTTTWASINNNLKPINTQLKGRQTGGDGLRNPKENPYFKTAIENASSRRTEEKNKTNKQTTWREYGGCWVKMWDKKLPKKNMNI